jgi:hypothetical protein
MRENVSATHRRYAEAENLDDFNFVGDACALLTLLNL